jgi:O-antigen biosynthesis protein
VKVLIGKKTWVGYIQPASKLPGLRKNVLGANGVIDKASNLPPDSLELIDQWYARDYEPLQDIRIIFKNYRYLGG